MDNKLLVDLYPKAVPALAGQVENLAQAQKTYGEQIPKFFGPFYKPIGIEFEMEGMHHYSPPTMLRWLQNPLTLHNYYYWKVIKDGSLRNGGIELVSQPVVGHAIDYALHEIECYLKHCGNIQSSSIRTSTHVHIDMSTYRRFEVFSLIALYALFERPLFSIQSDNRKHNPYCYSITQLAPDVARVNGDMKYCALNLAPIEKQLTVEFRHGDFNISMRDNRRWIQIVCKLMRYAEEHKETLRDVVLDVVYTGEYLKLFSRVMGKSVVLFPMDKVEQMMKQNAPWAVATLEVF